MTDQLREKFENLELNAGLGKISAFISMSLALLCVFGALCFLFPTVMTMPELRPIYAKHYQVFYFSLMAGIFISAGFGAFSAIVRQNRYGFYGLCIALLAAVLGCGLIKAPVLPSVPFYAGIDYFVLTLVILAFILGLDNFITNQKVLKLRYDWVKQVL